MTGQRKCEACGGTLPPQRGSRPRRWCSDACRTRASRARRLATAVVPGVSAEAAVDLVLASPVMSQKVLEGLAERIADGSLDGVENNHLVAAIIRAHRAVTARATATNRGTR